MITRRIREFVARDWDAARAAKDRYWADRIRDLGPLEALRIADELRRGALRQHATWPDAESRRQDLLSHARLVDLLRRAASRR